MKKGIIFLVIIIIITSGLTACGGSVKDLKITKVESELYTNDEIDSAIETIVQEFKKDWKGCTLKEIYYAGDETSMNHQDWADRNNVDEAIVLLSSFDVDESGGDGSLNPNDTYDNWMWILVRNDNGKWKHVDHGY